MGKPAQGDVFFSGTFSSLSHSYLVDSGCADYVCIGEGEFMISEFCRQLEESGKVDLDGFYSKDHRNEKIIYDDLNHIDIDYNLIDPNMYIGTDKGLKIYSYLQTAKGCVCSCAFCARNYLKIMRREIKIPTLNRWLSYIKKSTDCHAVYIIDELTFLNKNRLKEVLETFKQNDLHLYAGDLRVSQMNEDVLQLLSDYRVKDMLVGVETVRSSELNQIHKKISVSNITKKFELVSKYPKASIRASFIYGLPFTTISGIRENTKFILRIIKKVKNVSVLLTPWIPLPGTELWRTIEKVEKVKTIKDISRIVINGQFKNRIREADCFRVWIEDYISIYSNIRFPYKGYRKILRVPLYLKALMLESKIRFTLLVAEWKFFILHRVLKRWGIPSPTKNIPIFHQPPSEPEA